MEIYSVFQTIFQLGYRLRGKEFFRIQALIGSLLIALIVVTALFIVQGVGVYTMAKKRGFKRAWLAFVPFANTQYLGKLAGDCSFFGHKMKGAGIYAMVAQIVTFVGCALMIVAQTYLFAKCGFTIDESTGLILPPPEPTKNALILSNVCDIGSYVLNLFMLVYQILLFIVIMGIYKSYCVKNYTFLSFLQLFVPMSRYIVLCVIRNNQQIDYEQYIKQKREEYMRKRQQYNPYGQYGPYSQQNPYAGHPPYNNPQQGTQKKPDEEPFSEFSSDKKPGSGSGGENSGDDSFFS